MPEGESISPADKLNKPFAPVRPSTSPGHECGNAQVATAIGESGVSVSQSCIRQFLKSCKADLTLRYQQALANSLRRACPPPSPRQGLRPCHRTPRAAGFGQARIWEMAQSGDLRLSALRAGLLSQERHK